jgi:hypothetical protein
MKLLSWLLLFTVLTGNTYACIWDADTLFQEKLRHHDLSSAILGEPPPPEDPQKLQARITGLEANRNETNADWWNNLAGAYLRLNKPDTAVKLLEPVIGTFPNDYGIHANLGTAYHLLGRYAEAEKEIARDLEINPEAHFGLEKYHLALLQYLVRDKTYQARHVYVDEFTSGLCGNGGGHFYSIPDDRFQSTHDGTLTNLAELENMYRTWVISSDDDNSGIGNVAGLLAATDEPPKYRSKWDLSVDTNLVAGVIYMAEMNPKEPACFTMLGVAAWKKRDFNLAVSAFKKAVVLDSPQRALLQAKINGLNHFIHESYKEKLIGYGMAAAVILFFLCLLSCIGIKIWQWRMAMRE